MQFRGIKNYINAISRHKTTSIKVFIQETSPAVYFKRFSLAFYQQILGLALSMRINAEPALFPSEFAFFCLALADLFFALVLLTFLRTSRLTRF